MRGEASDCALMDVSPSRKAISINQERVERVGSKITFSLVFPPLELTTLFAGSAIILLSSTGERRCHNQQMSPM
jgi:hypothetical protein